MPYNTSNKSIQDSAFTLRSGNKPSPAKFFGIHKFLSGLLTAGNRILGKGGKGKGKSSTPPPQDIVARTVAPKTSTQAQGQNIPRDV